jgi:ubiquinone/menaquinone biosynthesis C-methylase UbiE
MVNHIIKRDHNMSFLAAYLYDKVMAETEAACLQKWRRDLLSGITGHVLEIGSGTGANLSFYTGKALTLTLCEPDPTMRKQLIEKLNQLGLANTTVSTDGAEIIQVPDHSLDYVVSTLVCCSVKDLATSLLEIKRVLKPSGKFVFLEHVAADAGSGRRKWQNILNPVWRKLAGNCHLNRNTQQAILDAGFHIESLVSESMRKAMPLVRPTIRGIAVSPAQVI